MNSGKILIMSVSSLILFLMMACSHSATVVDGDLADGDQESSNDGDPEPEEDGDLEPPVDGDQESERISDGDIVSDGDAASDGDAEEEIAPNSAAVYGELWAPVEAGGKTSYFEMYDEEPIIGAVPNGSKPISVVDVNPPSFPIDGGVAYAFEFPFLPAGSYWIRGAVDLNGDGHYFLEDGEFAFASDQPFVLSPGEVISNARIYLNFEDPARGSVSGTLSVPERYNALGYSMMLFDHEVDINTVLDDKPIAEAELTGDRDRNSTMDFRFTNLGSGNYYLYSQVNPCEGQEIEDVRVGAAYPDNPLVIDLEGEKDLSSKDLDYSSVNLGCPGVPQGRLCGSVRAPSSYTTMPRAALLYDTVPEDLIWHHLENTVDEGDGSTSFPFCYEYLSANDYYLFIVFDKNANQEVDGGELEDYGKPPYHLEEGEEIQLEPYFFDWQAPDLGRIGGTVLTGANYLMTDGFTYNVSLFDTPLQPGITPVYYKSCTIPDPQHPESMAFEFLNLPADDYYMVLVVEICQGPGVAAEEFQVMIEYPANPISIAEGTMDHLSSNFNVSGENLLCPLK